MAEKRKLLIAPAYFAPNRAVGAKRFTCEIFEARGYEVSVGKAHRLHSPDK